MKRVILVIIDSLGIGYMKDVVENRKQDIGANTLKHVIEKAHNISLNNLEKLGLFNALGEEVKGHKFSENAIWGRANLGYKGADSFLGHLKMFGYNTEGIEERPIRFYIDTIKKVIENQGFNVSYHGDKLKYLIVNDSVLIADNIEAEPGSVYSVIGDLNKIQFDKIKEIANYVREIVDVSRVVSVGCNIHINELNNSMEVLNKKYIGLNSQKCNLYNRGYIVEHMPYKVSNEGSVIRELIENQKEVCLIGKVADVIPDDNLKKFRETKSKEVYEKLKEAVKNLKCELIAVNFQDCDLAGHLQDTKLYASELENIDKYIGYIMSNMSEEDVLIVTADHGNDPTIGHRYHTREKVPVLLYGEKLGIELIGEFESLDIIGGIIKSR